MTNAFRFYPIDVSYSIIDEKPAILLYGRTEDRKRVCVVDFSFRPYFIVIPDDNANLSSLTSTISLTQTEDKTFSAKVTEVMKEEMSLLGVKKTVLKVYVNFPKSVPMLRSIIKDIEGVNETYEYDIKFVRRYMMDKKILPLSPLEVTGEPFQMKSRVPVIKAESVSPIEGDSFDEPKIIGFDIETYNPDGRAIDPKNNPIIMISFYGADYKKVITWKKFPTDHAYIQFVDSESDLIEAFKSVIEKEKPDILTGYFSEGFDLPYIVERAKKYRIPLDIGLDYSGVDVKRQRNKSGTMTGIVHLDMHAFIKNIFGRSMKLDSLSLDEVSKALLGEKKDEVDMDALADTWDNHPEMLEKYGEYNLQDSLLVYEICRKLFPNITELSKMIGINIQDCIKMGMSQLIEWYLIRMAGEINEIVPNKPGYEEIRTRMQHTFQGAFVFEPSPGLYKNLVIFDYRSLYPSIISSHNISPETYKCRCCRDLESSAEGGIDGIWFCKKKKGFIPTIINDLITRRIRIKKIISSGKEDAFLLAKQQNLKLIANSSYGYLGFYAARWYSLESAEAVTSWGRHYINMVIERAEETGFKVVYGDTDSIFLKLDGKEINDARKLIDRINLELPELMELEFEGHYPSGIFVKAKASETGAKKRYALLDDKGNILIKGFETVRRNWSRIGKDVQKNVLDILLRDHDPKKAVAHIGKIIQKLRAQEMDIDSVTISTQIQKKIKDYDTQGPHVKAAMRIEKKGIVVNPGMIINYVVTRGEGNIGDRVKLPDEVTKEDYDAEYYINNQIIPAVDRILEIFGYSGKELSENKEQSKLSGFFT